MRSKYIAAMLIAVALSGCGVYQSPKMADYCPDSINLTEQVDNRTGDTSEYVGASWNLNKVSAKPDAK
jgi:PBP1b-binding outer membrane lipoprotein LpoB